MHSIDILIILVVLFFGGLGIYWGLIRQVLAVAGLIAGLAMALGYHERVADELSSFVADDRLLQVLAFIFILVAISSIASLLASLLHRFAGLLFLGWLDHLLGGLLGALQGILACTILLIVAAMFPDAFWAASLSTARLAPWLIQTFGAPILFFVPESFRLATQGIFAAP